MASNIIIGSLIACKILISEPVLEKKTNNAIKNIPTGTNSTVSRMMNTQINKNIGNSLKQPKTIDREELVVGKVLEIEENEYWAKLDNGKYKKAKSRMLKVESQDTVDVLYIKEDACALYKDMIEEEVLEVKVESNKEEVKVEKKINKKKKVAKKKKASEYEEEYIVVPLDYDLKDKGSYIEVEDKNLKKKVNKAITSYLRKNNYNIATDKEIAEYEKKKKEKAEFLDKVAERQKNIFEEEEIIVETQKVAKKINPKKSVVQELNNKKEESFFGGGIIANFEDDLAKKLKKEKKVVKLKKDSKVNNVVKNKLPKKEKKVVVKKKASFDNLTLIAKAFSLIVKEW